MLNKFLNYIVIIIKFTLIPFIFFIPFIIWGEIRNLLIDVDYVGQLIVSGEEDKFVGVYLIFLYLLTFFGVWLPFITQNKKILNFTSYVPSLLPALGLVGTFLGIFKGLGEFDPGNIDLSLPILLDGLKLAFSTSIVGMVGSAVVKLISFTQPEIVQEDTISEQDFYNQFKIQNENLLKIEKGIRDMEIKLAEFTSSLGESTVEQLIKAIESVIRDFNTKIEEQFGENFKKFNSGLEKLLEWQSTYLTELDNTKKAIDVANNLIETHEKTVESIHIKLAEIPNMLNPVSEIIETINKERKQTEQSLDILSKLREDAENAIPSLQASLKQLTATLSADISDVSNKLQKLDQEMSNELEKAIQVMGAHLGSLSEQLVKDYQPLVTNLRNLIEIANRNKTNR
jgi:hypothetical protein